MGRDSEFDETKDLIVALLFLLGALIGVVVLTAGAIALARRDKDRMRGSGHLGAAMQNLESLFVESKKHVIEAEQDEHAEADESGEPPVP